MKRIIACALTLILLICALTSCGATYEKNVWFSEEKLEECLVVGLPGITRSIVKCDDQDVYVSMPNAELKAYIESVYEFLKAQEFMHLGTRGEQAFSFKGLFTQYYFKPVEDLDDFWVNGDWIFVYSDGSVDEDGDVIFCILTIYDYGKRTLTYGRNKEFSYNVKISLRRQSEAPLSGGYVLEEEHEHTITYVSAGESGHFENYTCGCSHDHGAVPHYDEDIDLICDACGYDMNEDYPPLVDVTTSLTQFASWLTELNAENVAEIKTTFEYVGVAPGRLKDISRTTDKTVIADVLDKYASTKMRPVTREETCIDGGSAFTIEFTLTDGTVKQLHFNNGFYAYGLYEVEVSALCYFELDSIPNLEVYNSDYAIPVSKFFGFITYIGTGEVYPGDLGTIPEQQPESICIIDGIGDIGFISIDKKPDKLPEMPIYQIETEFGVLDIYGAYNFEYNGTHYLRVDGGNLLDMIEDAINNNDTKGLEYNN